jgi:MFS family permease
MSTPQTKSAQKRIQPGEKTPVLLLALIFVLFKTGLEISGNFAEVIYFRRVGVENLPQLYSVEPLALVFVLVIFGLVVDRINRHKLLLGLNLLFAALLIAARFLIQADWPQVYFALYISQRIFLALLPLAFWLVCSDLFDIRQAKRLFVLIVASGLVGTLLGNLLTGLLSGIFAPEGILTLTSLFFIASLGVGILLSRLNLPKSFVKPKASTAESFSPILPLDILKQPFIQIFSLVILITGMLEPVWRYELNAIANQSFATENSLIAFYGYFKGAAVLVVVLFQLFLAGRLVEKMGIPWTISAHPLGLVGIMLLLGLYPQLWMAVASVALIGIVRIGFDESGREAIVGIYPPHERARVSTFERQMTYLGIFLGGLFLMWAVERLTLTQINWIAATFAATWILAFSRFRKRYAEACLRRGQSPLDDIDLPLAVEGGQAEARFEQFIAARPQSNLSAAIQGAGLGSARLDALIVQAVDQAGERALPHLQVALRSPVWRVNQFGAQCLLNGIQPGGGVEARIAIQLDYADQLSEWRGIPKIQKLIKEQRTAAAEACLRLLEARVAARMVHSRTADVRANGLEALDINLRGAHKARLMALFESVFSGDAPVLNAAQNWQAVAQSSDPEVAFWGQVWRMRSGAWDYIPPAPIIPAELTALLAAVTFPQTGGEAMQLADKIDALRTSETFAALGETELRVLALCAKEAEYAPDEVVFEEGQKGDALYIILEGHVELASVEEKKTLQALGPGGVFGEHALFTEEPYSLTAVTISQARMLILEREMFLELIQVYPNISLSLLRNLAQRFEKATTLLQQVWI